MVTTVLINAILLETAVTLQVASSVIQGPSFSVRLVSIRLGDQSAVLHCQIALKSVVSTEPQMYL